MNIFEKQDINITPFRLSRGDVGKALLAMLAYYVFFQAFYNEITLHGVWVYATWQDFLTNISLNLCLILLTSIYTWLIVFKAFIRLRPVLKIPLDLGCSLAATAVLNMAYALVAGIWREVYIDWAGTIFNSVVIFLAMEVWYYVSYSRKSLIATETARQKAVEFRYDALRAQVNPHFLFNTLNILYSLADIDTEKTKSVIFAISEVYRYILSSAELETVRLSDELEWCSKYITILQMRYGDLLTVEVSGEENVGRHTIIPLSLQMSLENVTKHNVISKAHPMTVTIAIHPEYVEITNPVKPRNSGTRSTHFSSRYLQHLYGRHGRVFSAGIAGDGRYHVRIPYIDSPDTKKKQP